MKKTTLSLLLAAAMMLSLAACGGVPAGNSAPAEEAESQSPASDDGQIIVEETPETAAPDERQDGERFEAVIMMEGMEETVRYEHIRREDLGFAMDYDYENFVRQSDGERERFVSDWDDPANPENYLEVSYDTGNANLVADAISATLSQEYDLSSAERELDNGVNCVRIEASVVKGTNQMADLLQEIYIIPAGSGSIVARACYAIEGAEGFGRRFAYMVRSLNVLERKVEGEPVEDELALSIIRNYCLSENPDLQEIVDAGEYPVSWEIESSDGQQVVILFRSYTGALVRYYIDRATGDTYVTEFVPGITAEEQRTEESFNLWDQVG